MTETDNTKRKLWPSLHEEDLMRSGARDFVLKLWDDGWFDNKCKRDNSPAITPTKDFKVYQKALMDMFFDDKTKISQYILDGSDAIRFSCHERDKKGKLIKVKAELISL